MTEALPTPDAPRPTSRRGLAAAAAGGVLVTAGYWLANRARQSHVEDRTRDRLRPRSEV